MPVKMEDLKKLPIIPQTSTVKMNKKWKTDLHHGHALDNFMSLDEAPENEELLDDDSDDEYLNKRDKSNLNYSSLNQTMGDEDTTTVFDLVHRGR